MALIVREEIKEDCFLLGKRVQFEVINKRDISDERMEGIVKESGIVEKMVERIEKSAQNELDEYMGKEEDKREDEAREDMIEERRAAIEDSAYFIGTYDEKNISRNIAEKAAKLSGFTLENPKYNLYNVDDDDFMCYDEGDNHWEDYMPTLTVDDEHHPMEKLIGGDMGDVLNYIKNAKSVEEIKQMLIEINNANVLCYRYAFSEMKGLVDLIIDSNMSIKTPVRAPTPVGAPTQSKKRKRFEEDSIPDASDYILGDQMV